MAAVLALEMEPGEPVVEAHPCSMVNELSEPGLYETQSLKGVGWAIEMLIG